MALLTTVFFLSLQKGSELPRCNTEMWIFFISQRVWEGWQDKAAATLVWIKPCQQEATSLPGPSRGLPVPFVNECLGKPRLDWSLGSDALPLLHGNWWSEGMATEVLSPSCLFSRKSLWVSILSSWSNRPCRINPMQTQTEKLMEPHGAPSILHTRGPLSASSV